MTDKAENADRLIEALNENGYEVHVMWPAKHRKDLNGRIKLYRNAQFQDSAYFGPDEFYGNALARVAERLEDG